MRDTAIAPAAQPDAGAGRRAKSAPQEANKTIIRQLRQEIDRSLDGELEGVRSVALVDFPDHPNVGDSAIYLGEITWLRARHGITPDYVCTVDNFSPDALRRAVPDGPIFFHGGGNFGDIWPHHQRLRETVLQTFPGRRIVQLPQTIHFDDPSGLHRVQKLIAAHGNFLLLVRDRKSLELARTVFDCEVRLCPDMALALGPRTPPVRAFHPLVLLLRSDREQAGRMAQMPPPAGALASDWLHEPHHLRESMRWLSALRVSLGGTRRLHDRNHHREYFYAALAARRVARGLRLLGSGRSVITDRLHGHLLCLLLGLPHIVFDNRYGKLDGFIGTWTANCGLVERTPDLPAALRQWNARFHEWWPGVCS